MLLLSSIGRHDISFTGVFAKGDSSAGDDADSSWLLVSLIRLDKRRFRLARVCGGENGKVEEEKVDE